MNGKGVLGEIQAIPKREIWAIGGGKGGTGKSFIVGNLGIYLAKMGKQVILIDVDLGCEYAIEQNFFACVSFRQHQPLQ